MDNVPKEQLNLDRLRARVREKPKTKIGQVRQAWPEIQDLFAAGHSLKDIWTWLNEIGIEIAYTRLSEYIGRIRRREAAQVELRPEPKPAEETGTRVGQPTAKPNGVRAAQPPAAKRRQKKADPIANVLEREQQRPGFNYNSDPDLKKLI